MAFEIAGREIGPEYPPYVIAELSANHGGTLAGALALIEAAKLCGADAIKLQTYTAETMTIDHDGPDFVIKGGLWDGERLFDLYNRAHTPWEWHSALFQKGNELGVPVFSTPFDETAVDLLEELKVPAYKIASFELVDLRLIQYVAARRKPTIMSTGMASPREIDGAVETFFSAGGRDLILLHCISGYPTPVEQLNLRRIPELAERYGCPVGLSDHTLGIEAAIAAVALGACVIEKHFTLSRADGGPDSEFSIEPSELTALVRSVRRTHSALGSGEEDRPEVEKGSLVFRRSIYVVRDIEAGDVFTSENIRIIRPGFGLEPRSYDVIVGKRATCAIKRGTALTADMVEGYGNASADRGPYKTRT